MSSNLSPSIIQKIEFKEIFSVSQENNDITNTRLMTNINEVVEIKPKFEEKIELAVIIERKNNCLQTTIERFLNKFEIANFLSINKKLSKVAVTQLIKSIKIDIKGIEDKIKILKEVKKRI